MKVLNIAMRACFAEGYSYQDNVLPEYQCKLGNEVTFVTSTKSRDENGKTIKVAAGSSILDNGVKIIRINTGNAIFNALGIFPSLRHIIREEAPDLIFVHALPSFVPAQAIAYQKKHPSVVLVADNHQDERNTKLSGFPFAALVAFWRWCWKRWIKHFSHIYGVTSWRTEFAHKCYGIPLDKLDTLIMGVDNDRLPLDREGVRLQIREELGFKEDDLVFVSGGKLEARKRVLETMTAFTECKKPNLRLLLFGSLTPDIRDPFNQILQQDDRIKYIGFIPSLEVHHYFIASDFGLFPGSHSVLWEEASGCGLPCLFSKFTENDHLQVCGNCLQLSPEAPRDAIRDVISRIADDRDYYLTLKENAQKAAPSFYYDTIARKSLER